MSYCEQQEGVSCQYEGYYFMPVQITRPDDSDEQIQSLSYRDTHLPNGLIQARSHTQEFLFQHRLLDHPVHPEANERDAPDSEDIIFLLVAQSRIDLLAEFEEPVSLMGIVDAEIYLTKILGTKADLVPRKDVRPELEARITKGTTYI
jgi:hypothetical protein